MSAAAEKVADLRGALARLGLGDTPGQARAVLGHPDADACLLGGILQGALHEVFPAAAGDEAAAAGFAVALATRAAQNKSVLWLRPDFSALEHGEISPLGLLELGLDPSRFLLLKAPDAGSVLRAGLDALSCAALGAVVLELPEAPKLLDLAASRRLVLAAAQSGASAVLLRLDAHAEPSAAETRWFVRPRRSQRFPPPAWGRSRAQRGGGGCDFPRTSPSGPSGHLPHAGGGKEGGGNDWGFPLFEAELVRHRHGRSGHWVMEWRCDDGLFAAPDPGAVVSAVSHRPAQAQGASCVA